MLQSSPLIGSILMIATILLALGGLRLVRRPADRRRGILMLVAAAVILVDVLILTVPF